MGFSLDMPDEAAIKEQVKAELAPLPERKEAIAEVAGKNADAFLTVDLNSFDERKELTTAIETFGADLVKDSATKNELLKTKVGDLGNFGGASADVAKGLEDLTIEMKDLDPSAIDFMKTGPLGKISPSLKTLTRQSAISSSHWIRERHPLEMTIQHWSWNRHPCVI